MPLPLRPYQAKLKTDVQQAWAAGARNVLMRLDTGGGKTVIIADLHAEHRGASAVIAHRHELVGQLSQALARLGVQHNLIASSASRRGIVQAHMLELGRCFYNPSALVGVCSIDTLTKAKDVTAWASRVTLWTTDEGHHVVEGNKWHRGLELFTHPEVRGLLPSATPARADGKGLGREWDGVADVMVQGPPMRWLIEEGYLTDYRVVCATSDMELLESEVGASGDWSTVKLRAAVRGSHIVGDIVKSYKEWCAGMRHITFTPDRETALEVLAEYRREGVRAEVLTGETEPGLRRSILKRFESGEIDELVVVDIVSEGFDMPAVQAGSFGRKTMSLATYMQQFGRMLRPLYAKGYDLSTREGRLAAIANSVKPFAWVIDHVGNFLQHGPPDRPRPWTLAARGDKRAGSRGIPLTSCGACFRPYERVEPACPYCGAEPEPPEPGSRARPETVDGDLALLSPETLAALRGAVESVDRHPDFYRQELAAKHAPAIGIMAHVKRFAERQDAQSQLRAVMDLWAGRLHAAGASDRKIQRAFFHTFGTDVLSALVLGADDADALRNRIEEAMR